MLPVLLHLAASSSAHFWKRSGGVGLPYAADRLVTVWFDLCLPALPPAPALVLLVQPKDAGAGKLGAALIGGHVQGADERRQDDARMHGNAVQRVAWQDGLLRVCEVAPHAIDARRMQLWPAPSCQRCPLR